MTRDNREMAGPMHRDFMANVKARRLELGLTQSDVAHRMKITQSTYADIENGRRTPTLDAVDRVAKALRCSWRELLKLPEVASV